MGCRCLRTPSGVRWGNSGGHQSRGTVLGQVGIDLVELWEGVRKGRLEVDSEDKRHWDLLTPGYLNHPETGRK